MKTNILTLCDFAKDYNGQLNISGTFNLIRSAVFPTAPISFYIVCQFVIKENIEGDHFVTISVTNNETGNFFVQPQEFKLSVGKNPDASFEQDLFTNLILGIEKTVFENPGSYTLKVVSDGNVQELNFYVLKV